MEPFVLDGSTAVSWCFEELQTPYATAILGLITRGAEVYVPPIWPLEVTNALVKTFRRQLITQQELREYTEQLAAVRVKIDFEGTYRTFTETVALAKRYQLSTYDAAYLELALRKRMPLATGDRNMMQAARGLNVPILEA